MAIHRYYVPKKSPYYEVLKKAEKKEKAQWCQVKVMLGGIYYALKIIMAFLVIKKKLKNTFMPSQAKSRDE